MSNGCHLTRLDLGFHFMDPIRRRIDDRLKELGKSQSWLSLKIGRNRAYIYQYLMEKRPPNISDATKRKIAEALEMPESELGLMPAIDPPLRQLAAGFEDDAEPYNPGPDSHLRSRPHMAYFTMKNRALDQHPERILPGRILMFDINKSKISEIPSGKIVVVQLCDRFELTRSHGTVIRQFIAPNKIITNSSEFNEIISLDDEALPFIPVVKSTFVTIAGDLN